MSSGTLPVLETMISRPAVTSDGVSSLTRRPEYQLPERGGRLLGGVQWRRRLVAAASDSTTDVSSRKSRAAKRSNCPKSEGAMERNSVEIESFPARHPGSVSGA